MAPPRHAPPLITGVVANTLDAGRYQGSEQRLIRRLGVRWIREELRWASIEPLPGVFRWGSFDALLTSAARNGLHVLPLLIDTPGWAGPAELALPNDPAQFGAFAAAAAARYGPGGSFWRAHPQLDSALAPRWFELWNEPYMPYFSSTGLDPAKYAQMVVAATTAGKAANPRTRWLMAVDLLYGTPEPTQDWIAALYAADPQLNRSFDGVAVHPYSDYGPAPPPNDPTPDRFDRIGAIWDELNAHGAGNRPIWITELGWSTCDLRPDCTSPQGQAQNLADAFALVRTRYANIVPALFVYDLRDIASGNLTVREDHYGLLEADGTPKPAWQVMRVEAQYAQR